MMCVTHMCTQLVDMCMCKCTHNYTTHYIVVLGKYVLHQQESSLRRLGRPLETHWLADSSSCCHVGPVAKAETTLLLSFS